METLRFLTTLQEESGKQYMPQSRIRIEHPLRQGALSESYLAHHEGFNLPCILRVLKPDVSKQLDNEEIDAGFAKASQQYAAVRHPSITALYDMGTYAGFEYALIEYVAGIPLNERIKERPLTDCEALKLMGPIADGLAALWQKDYVHRGVSPMRVLIAGDGTPKLDMVILPRVALSPLLIEAHAPFMAGFWPPEELRQSLDIDARSDMFSFGASLYYAVTGASPFGKGSRTELIAKTMTEAPTPPEKFNSNVCPKLSEFILRCLQRDQKNRFNSTHEFIGALTEVKNAIHAPSTNRPSSYGPLRKTETLLSSTFGVGDTVGQCHLEQMVGSGAFGVVFKARHQLLDIPVAVKFLPKDLAAKNPEYVDLFLREARTAIRIRHKNVIGLYEAGVDGGQYYLIMEFAPGGSVLERFIRSGGKLPVPEVIRLLRETASGLAAAEEMSIIHRDIKPANLMFGSQNEIKIADLGLAKRVPRAVLGKTEIDASVRREQLTMQRGESLIQGTPAYIAPEMALAPESVDIRADLYSLGVTAYELLTGKLPFDAQEPMQVMMKHVTEPVKPLRKLDPKIPERVQALVLRLLEKSPDDRYQSAKELVQAVTVFG